MNEMFFNALLVVVMVAILVFMSTIVPWIITQIKDTKYGQLLDTVEKAVKAAEQKIKESGMGKIKKAQVITEVTFWLNQHGVYVTEDQLDMLIEAAVWAMNNEDKQ